MAVTGAPKAAAGEQKDATKQNLPEAIDVPADIRRERKDEGAVQRQLTLLVLLGEEVAEDTPSTLTAPESVSKVVFPRFMNYLRERYSGRVQVIAGASLESFLHQGAALQNAEALFVLGVELPYIRELLRHVGPQIRWIHSFGAGVTSLTAALRETPWPGCPTKTWASQAHVLVTNGRTVFSRPLAEYVFAAVLHFYKQIPRLKSLQEKCAWVRFPLQQLRGKTMGFLGFGDVGRECALLAKAFGMKCTALRSSSHAASTDLSLLEHVWTQKSDDRYEFYRCADVVVCSLPGTPDTEKCVGAREFAAFKKTSIFISIGRGSVVDEEALLQAVQTKRIAGAALDVFQKEPLPADSPLWKEEGILISSHCCDWVDDHSAAAAIDVFDENLRRFLAGAQNSREMFTPVDVHRGY